MAQEHQPVCPHTIWVEATKDAGTMTEHETTKTMTTIVARMEQQMAAAGIDIETTTTKGQIQRAVKTLERMDVRIIQGINETFTKRQEKKQEQEEKREQERKQKQKEKQVWMEKKRKDEEDKERERKI